jgi:hypothetical protein
MIFVHSFQDERKIMFGVAELAAAKYSAARSKRSLVLVRRALCSHSSVFAVSPLTRR